jgi:hypothetical protein
MFLHNLAVAGLNLGISKIFFREIILSLHDLDVAELIESKESAIKA